MQRLEAVSGHPGTAPGDFFPGALPRRRASFKSEVIVPSAARSVDGPLGSFRSGTKGLLVRFATF